MANRRPDLELLVNEICY